MRIRQCLRLRSISSMHRRFREIKGMVRNQAVQKAAWFFFVTVRDRQLSQERRIGIIWRLHICMFIQNTVF